MPLRVHVVSALTASLLLQPACATSPMPSKCTATGSLAALPDMGEQAICDRFERDLAAALGTADAPEGLVIALTLHKRGAIEAQLTALRDGEPVRYPVIAVDAIDRVLQPGDLARLASVAAEILTDQESGHAGRPTVNHKGE